ncbi:hypothetical protein Vretimale_10959 [Volvox reticuliferus]|uniref:Protein kinase domain-containing protein n=1 Tax=Volvox reticuliferus TaxID=1737510 RepID=A0A8J4CL33_9CHLO|nr:hypothetical protein Vretifemale_12662 [Volvox reticuliferus]GIM06683.1 hypothetical protein Vretimale_10959 [Volvox reticuliferus]
MDGGPMMLRNFQIVNALGSGSFGTVRLVKDINTDKHLAMKILNRRDASKYVEDEIVNHSLLRHPHIVHFREVFIHDDFLCIVMEFANGGSLFSLVRKERRLKESMARWFFQQLILAVDYCHKRGVANRDIKLENLLLHTEDGLPHPLLKMCDFGYSKADFRSAAKSQVGTVSYMAPEVMKSCGKYYDAKVADVWSCGVVLYVMLYGLYPFDNQGEDQGISEAQKVRRMLDRMETEAYVLNPSVSVTDECIDMLRGMLKPAPEQRLTIEKIMEHPWFNKKLPPQAREMNMYYLNLPVPPEYQQPDQIKGLLQEARAVGGR